MKKILVFITIICLFGCTNKKTTIETVARVTTVHEEKSNDDLLFEQKTNEIFTYILSDSPIDINFYLRYPKTFGLDKEVYDGISFSESNTESINEMNNIISELKMYEDDTLTRKNQLTKDIIIDFLEQTIALSDNKFIYYNSQLGSYLGYQTNLPVILSMYRFDDESDVLNYFSYLNKTKEDFDAIIEFECKKIPLGMSLPDVVLHAVITKCSYIVASGEDFFETIFSEKIKNLNLTETRKNELINLDDEAVENFISAYNGLKNNIETKLLGQQSKTTPICQYGPDGKEYYEFLFKQSTGCNKDLKIVEKEIYNELNRQSALLYLSSNSIMKADFAAGKGYKQILDEYISNKALWKDFPTLGNDIKYNLNYVDESLQFNFSPAAYFVSPCDEEVVEQIIINEKTLNMQSSNYVYQTMAHEGVPGHLYQTMYFKQSNNFSPIRTLVTCNGYNEGWATYVQYYVLKYSDYDEETITAYQSFNLMFDYLWCYLDIMINYECWDVDDVLSFTNEFGLEYQRNEIVEIYEQIIEIPTNFSVYTYGYYQVLELKEKAKKICKGSYSDKAFHTFLLEIGSAPFYIIEEHLSEILYYI